MTRKLVTAK
jgi:hypothetical protein